jgi:hypothetical protein
MINRIARIGVGVFLMALPLLWSPAHVSAAYLSFKPSVSVSEEFTDNVYEQSDNRRSEFISRLKPGFSLNYLSPFWSWDVAYNFDYRNYAKGSRDDEFNHDAAVKGNVVLVKNFLYLDVSETYRRVSLNVARPLETESSLFLNQSDQNTASISPYLVWRLRRDDTLKTGYRFTDTRYFGQGGIDKQEHRGFADLTHQFSSRFSATAGYAFTRLESSPTLFNKHEISSGLRYEYADKSFLFGQIGNSWQQFGNGVGVSYLFWNAGVTHDFRSVVVTLEAKSATAEDPLSVSTREMSYSAKLEKVLQRGMLGMTASYSEYTSDETNTTDRTRLAFSATGRYEFLRDLTGSLTATWERFKERAPGYLYRFTPVAGLSYALKNDLSLGLTYTYVNSTGVSDMTSGAYQVNKVVLELKKLF